MAINKVVYGNQTLVDLTSDTVSSDKLLSGETAHDRSGNQISGSVVVQNYTAGDGIDISANNEISVDTTFTEASTRTNISSGDTLATIWGKIKKFFSDLKTVAFSGSYNDLTDKPNAVYTAQASSSSVGSVIVTHVELTGSTRSQMYAYGNGNGTPWSMGINFGADWVRCVVLCNAQNRVGVRYIDSTHFAIISGTWDIVVVCGSSTDNASSNFSVATSSTSYTIDTASTYFSGAEWSYSVRDYSNNVLTKFGYSTAGMSQSDVTWLGAWDASVSGEYRLRAVKQSDLRVAYAVSAGSATDSTKVAKAGDTMSGTLDTTYKVGTWVGSLTKSAINLSEAAGSFGGLISAPTKNGRIAIATYQGNDDKLYIGYGEKGRTANSYTRSIAWNGATGKLEASITGNCDGSSTSCTGNAATATTASKLGSSTVGSASRPIYLNGGTPTQISYTIEKSVPSNAVFTDTNTWRGIQNNLTSTSTTDSLSANQGRLLANGSARDSTKLPLSGGTMTGLLTMDNAAIAVKKGKALELYSSDNSKAAVLSVSSNGTLNIVSGASWLNLRADHNQCRNINDTAWSACAASAFNINSSIRYKENIEDISDEEAAKLLDVRIVKYDYKENITDEEHRYNRHGVIAEEVDKIIPEVVTYAIPYGHEDEFDEPVPDSVDYARFVPHLIKLVQMQQKEIDDLKKQVNYLFEKQNDT